MHKLKVAVHDQAGRPGAEDQTFWSGFQTSRFFRRLPRDLPQSITRLHFTQQDFATWLPTMRQCTVVRRIWVYSRIHVQHPPQVGPLTRIFVLADYYRSAHGCHTGVLTYVTNCPPLRSYRHGIHNAGYRRHLGFDIQRSI